MTQVYPLQWPAGVPRTPSHKRGDPKFVATIGGATKGLLSEVRLMGGTLPVISTNLALRSNGLPYASQRQPEDPGVAVHFQRSGKALVFACDRWRRIEHNMRAIVKTIEALRGIERWGSADMVDQAFAGFSVLPPPSSDWRRILDLPSGPVTETMIDAAFRGQAARAHPDTGGSTEALAHDAAQVGDSSGGADAADRKRAAVAAEQLEKSLVERDIGRAEAVLFVNRHIVYKALLAFAQPATPAEEGALGSYEKFDGIGQHAETVETRASIGERYLEAYESALSDPRLAGYSPADCPSELLLDLLHGDWLAPAPVASQGVGELVDIVRKYTVVGGYPNTHGLAAEAFELGRLAGVASVSPPSGMTLSTSDGQGARELALSLAAAHDGQSNSPTKAVTAIHAGVDMAIEYWEGLALAALSPPSSPVDGEKGK